METKILCLVSILLVLFVSGIPARTAKKSRNPQSLNHHARSKSEPVPLCEVTGSDLDSILARNDELMGHPDPNIFEPLFEMMMNRPIREFSGADLFCAVEGIGSIDDLFGKLTWANFEYYTFRAFRMGYIYGMINIDMMRAHLMRMLANSQDGDEEFIEAREERLALLSHLQASGITELDPRGYQQMMGLLASTTPLGLPDDWPEPEPLSDLPLEAQCARLTNDFRKVWNRMIKSDSEWMPEAGTYHREVLRNITGIDIPTGAQAHQVMKDTLCRLIEPSELIELSETMYELEILPSLHRYLYHQMVWAVDMFESRPLHYYYSDGGPDEDPGSVFHLVQNFLNNLRAMGLLDLQ